MTATETEEVVDTSDLDALDDATQHYYCTICYPKRRVGMLTMAACGVERLMPLHAQGGSTCADCLEAITKPCPRCGMRPS